MVLIKLVAKPQHPSKEKGEDEDAGLTSIDFEEQNAGYQAAYSRLAASEGGFVDPVGFVQSPLVFLAQSLRELAQTSSQIQDIIKSQLETDILYRRFAVEGVSL